MKADAWQQRSLLEISELDAELARIAYRAGHLPEQQRFQEVEAEQQAARDRVAVLQIAAEDIDAQVARLESEIDGVRQREDRDRVLLASPDTSSKQLTELQHELETLQRRQSSLEDSLLEVMERREDLERQIAEESAGIEKLDADLAEVRRERDAVLAEIENTRTERTQRRETLTAGIDPALLALYEQQRAKAGIGAGALQGRQCGACSIEIDRGEIARITAAAEDEVLRCPECNTILLRVKR
ncbi:zinc ribbon domain-containing protein [[Mycobacterium] burgundiense]|uniref:C4-type zinc ribbon domain-containing protein n=1 Tax=[Mycobacterium] burgundiense TaxID=3064286 RepID=A0ABM9LN58_9MYCO|nr:C4-type zinc ribbon domain-containing protein [Mycolicibacterium sp. MU0053]CAJ1501768.1 C4-type zinc ribbon domain-containing protein [Mycolicibacterium sp. MU0053]